MEVNNQSAPSGAAEVTETANAPEAQAQSLEPQTPQVQDIDAFSEFKFQGQSYTPEKLLKLFQEHKQFQESHQKASQYDDYIRNVEVDIQQVLKDPSLADEFKATYPKSFHGLLDQRLRAQSPAASQQANPQSPVPREFTEKISSLEQRLARYDQAAYEASVAKERAQIQSTVLPLFDKFEFADKDAVFARAQALSDQNYDITPAAWERIIKENHSANQKRYEQIHNAKVKKQIENGQQAKDVGPGGSSPGQAPVSHKRSLNEAMKEFERQVSGRKF